MKTANANGELKIEKGVPCRRIVAKRANADVIDRMTVGDSVFFTDKMRALAFLASVNVVTHNTAYRGSLRHVEGGYRVWKVERKAQGAA